MRKKKSDATITVDSIRHRDKRVNIPTEELRDFIRDAEIAPENLLYPRDPSLDPQLVWLGKDKQDRSDLAVPVVPIYIQEKIHPQAIIEALPRIARAPEDQPLLFGDFNGGPHDFEQRVDFYHHQMNWTNRLILGDSLLVMNSLAEKEALRRKVQMIYVDPPYGIRFGSNWQVSTRKRDVKDGKADDVTRQPEQVRAFRDTWKLGIHSYLAYLRDRFAVAHDLLTETGSMFVQIGEDNVHLVRSLLDEIFGSENFVAMITFQKTTGAGSFAGGTNVLASLNDYIVWYARDKSAVKYRQLFIEKSVGGEGSSLYTQVLMPDGSNRPMTTDERRGTAPLPAGTRAFGYDNLTSQTTRVGQTTVFPVEIDGESFLPRSGGWKTNREGMSRLAAARRIARSGNSIGYVRYVDDFPAFPLGNTWTDTVGQNQYGGDKMYAVQTALKAVERCVLMTTDPGDLVLDPTCGSGTTAIVAEQWGRRWITCDTSRVALALARTRLMSAKFPYYLLADSPEGIQKEAEITGKVAPSYVPENDIRKGFVYRRVPHVTLKAIANNSEIKPGMSRGEIDAAIARHADSEILYDQPSDDSKRVRVSGPLSVESLSPHRVLSTADDNLDGAVSHAEAQKHSDFATMIIDNLRKAGVQNTRKDERLVFERLDAYSNPWIHATGEYTDADGARRRVAVSIGPEHGTVGPQQIKEAAKEAVRGIGFDVLVVCGFAFDPHVTEEAKRYGKLTVLPAKMNPDLAMGDELLKKTGTGNLFMVFGEPDVEIAKQKNGEVIVRIKGVDVYDPTTGDVRSSSTDDIACWFIDTDYNGESFFVRHAYFTGAEEPYEKLKRALRAEIDEATWSTLYKTESRPFAVPESGKIAVKVINHYGDEVLKVFEV